MNSTIKELFENEFGLDVDTMPIGKPINVYESKVSLKGFDTKTNKVGFSRVRYAIKKPISDMLRITTEFDTLPDVSTKHLFATYDNGNLDWTLANDLQIGDYLYDANNNPIKITNIASVKEDYVYDVETDFGNYFSHGILSHNSPMAHLPTACVTPDTMIEIFEFEEDHISRITMETLFKKAGLENYSTLKVDTFYDISDKKLYTNSYNEKTQKVEKELIEALVYKGKAPIYELVNSNGEIFLKCSGKHRLYDPNMKDYVEVENIESIDALLSTGDIINLKVRKTDAEMPIVDLKVRNNHNYFPNSILSHNTGGEAINYYTSITCRITKTDDIKDATGDVCGIEMRVRNYKNKCSVPFRDANMKLYYDGGFDSNSEYIDFLLLLGMVKQAGAYFKFNHEGQDYSLQGRKKLQEWLDTHADVYDSWKKEIIEKISHHNEILDANNQATDENGNEISLDEAKKMGNAVDVADLASQALAAAAGND